MAKLLQAVNQYGPKLSLNPTAQLKRIAEWIAMRTGLNTSEVLMVLQELHEALLFFTRDGTPVKLPGIGTFTPSISRTGKFNMNLRADIGLKNGLNSPGTYTGQIMRKDRIGFTDQQYKDIWDNEHPSDLLEI